MKQLLFSCFIVLSGILYSNNCRKQTVNLKVKNEALKSVLYKIDDQTGYAFSYSPDYLPVDSLITENFHCLSLDSTLSILFKDQMNYKLVAKTIIIRPNSQFKTVKKEEHKEVQKLKKIKQSKHIYKGYVKSKYSGRPLSSVSVIDPENKHAVKTDSLGYFELELKSKIPYLELYFSKSGYEENVMIVKNSSSNDIQVRLEKIKSVISIVSKTDSLENSIPSDSLSVVKLFIDSTKNDFANNIDPFFGESGIQLSFTPGLSTNKSLNPIYENKFSLNVLGGYSKGVNGIELGGLFNINRKDMNGLQLGGLMNIVIEDVNGLQIPGIGNFNRYKMNGI